MEGVEGNSMNWPVVLALALTGDAVLVYVARCDA